MSDKRTRDKSAKGVVSAKPRAVDPLAGLDLAALKIVLWPDPGLKRRSEPVSVFDSRLSDLAARMFELMRGHRGVGLAAPQVGLNIRLFVANATGEPVDDRIYVNPVLSNPDGSEEREEGCLSLPDVNVDIVRPTRLHMQAYDVTGRLFEEQGDGFITRIWQHENDHLDGRLITDHMSPVTKMGYRKVLKKLEEDYASEQAARKRR